VLAATALVAARGCGGSTEPAVDVQDDWNIASREVIIVYNADEPDWGVAVVDFNASGHSLSTPFLGRCQL
jgi:hypothetical protein